MLTELFSARLLRVLHPGRPREGHGEQAPGQHGQGEGLHPRGPDQLHRPHRDASLQDAEGPGQQHRDGVPGRGKEQELLALHEEHPGGEGRQGEDGRHGHISGETKAF